MDIVDRIPVENRLKGYVIIDCERMKECKSINDACVFQAVHISSKGNTNKNNETYVYGFNPSVLYNSYIDAHNDAAELIEKYKRKFIVRSIVEEVYICKPDYY